MRVTSRTLTALATAALLAAGALSVIPSSAADAATQCAPNSSGTTPSLAVQNACGDHAMGAAGLPASPASTATPTPTAAASAGARSNAPMQTQAQAQSGLRTDATPSTGSDVKGFDISGWQPTTDWAGAVKAGYKFVFIKSTESNSFINPYFNAQWVDAGNAGLLRGAYHFAQPADSSGAVQADYFYQNGAAMSATTPGTLPPVLDAENSGCAGLSQAAMVSWISSFMSTLQSLTGRTPIIYTYQSWWNSCTGDNAALAAAYPLWISDPTPPAPSSPRIPSAWRSWTFWQWGYTAPFSGGGDADVFQSASLATLTASYGTYPRIAGTDRWATSTQTSQQFRSAAATSSASVKPGQTVYVADGENFPDALSGGAAAGLTDSPILLVQPHLIPAVVADQLAALKPKNIVVLGGTDAVSAAVQSALATYTASGSQSAVQRIGGADRWATSAAVATTKFAPGLANAYVTVGNNWPDALTGSAEAASPTTRGPVLLVQNSGIPTAVAQALATLKPRKITVFGGTNAVNSAVQAQLAQYTASKSAAAVVRLAGADRFRTSQVIASHLFAPGVSVAYVASGLDFPDALTGAPLSALAGGAPVLLTDPGAVPTATSDALTFLKPKSVVVLGGSDAVSAPVQAELQNYVVG